MSFKMDAKDGREPDPCELRKLLEWELSLDSGDLRSHGWYHGGIPRLRAEQVVLNNGHFLVRDCISQPGDYVLTCRWNGQMLHFVIQKTIVQANTIYEHIQYQLEGEAFDTIPDLITTYVGGKRPVTSFSGARMATPVNRTAPLSFYMSKYAAQAEHTRQHGTLSRPITKVDQRLYSANRHPRSVSCSVVRTPLSQTSYSPPKGGRPSSEMENGERSCSNDGIIGPRTPKENGLSNSHSLPRKFSSSPLSLPAQPLSSLNKSLTDSSKEKSPLPKGKITPKEAPPPKPSRVPSFKVKPKIPPSLKTTERIYAEIAEDVETEVLKTAESSENVDPVNSSSDVKVAESSSLLIEECDDSSSAKKVDGDSKSTEVPSSVHSRLSELYQPSGSDSGNGSGDSVQTSASESQNRDSQSSLTEPPVEDIDPVAVDDDPRNFMPEMFPPSAFDLDNFSTLLLPAIENRPLDATAFRGVKNSLFECGSRNLAAHLTRIDLDLLNGCDDTNHGLGVAMGLEMITLPQGSQLRKDLIERTECLKLLVAITILKSDDIYERAETIHRWIQVAIDTKNAMGNLYGFTGIMLGLCVPQIQRLLQTWHIVRQKHTSSAFNFESKLRSTLKSMNECTNPQAPNTLIPHLLPFILLCERDLEDIYSLHTKGGSLLQWESTSSDYGLELLVTHLQEARSFTQNLEIYRRNAEILMGEIGRLDELTLDMFRTEFQLKFLFGSKAAFASSGERIEKFEKVVETLSEFCEPSVNLQF